MIRRANRLALLALAVMSVMLYISCSQTDDIVTPVSTTVLTLDTRLLPTPPEGMVYELWVKNGADTVSIGRFRYDQISRQYLTEGDQVRVDGNTFRFSGDVLAFEEIFLSVENSPDDDPNSPANVMLWDRVTDPADDPLRLVFPMSDSLWYATCHFSMESPSDGDRSTNDGSGLWFAQYRVLNGRMVDTLDMTNVIYYDTVVNENGFSYTSDWVFEAIETVQVVYTFDTLDHIRVEYERVWDTVMNAPETIVAADVVWLMDSSQTFSFDDFTQGAEGYGLVDYTEYGFRYRGWVVSTAITAASTGDFTPPAWDVESTGDLIGITGGLISTGPFANMDGQDADNRYVASGRIPPFPGEDFMTNLPNGAAGPLNLLPLPTGNVGSVFITLEPVNYEDETTNFPLIAFAGALPSNQGQLTPVVINSIPTLDFQMRQYTAWSNPSQGFPRILITIERF